MARETLSRLERLHRPAQPETAEALAWALRVSVERLTTATEDLPLRLKPVRDSRLSDRNASDDVVETE